MPSILSDIPDALHSLQSPEFESSTGGKLRATRIAVSGSSAGGWLAWLVGTGHDFEACGLKAPPLDSIRAIAAIYTNTITSLADDLWLKKQHSISFAPEEKMVWPDYLEGALDPEGPVLAFSSPDTPRSKFYSYMVQDFSWRVPRSRQIQSKSQTELERAPSSHFPNYIVHGDIDNKASVRQTTDILWEMPPWWR
ncbi:hypothetical protein A4X13_0g9219 [Tilletia indica]|uniref:Alpha/beta hydrolase fold-3 domain-containing protein n=1 Tax=Tilletia indica TaxID=43049 RepID=A0A8T8SB24_9BASI|nr:hypothetical protein A4X13_0g9219 [Tilletia indica]